MNKAELIDGMAAETKLAKSQIKKSLESFINIVMKTLKKGKSVVLTNFGTFMVAQRKSRMGVNPSTGQKMKIPARKVPKFRPGKKLKSTIN
jgi:DNA-binding protein HU-beta